MNLVTQLRRGHFDDFVGAKAKKGLEIGPYNQPMVTKAEGNIKYLDHLTREQLLALNGVKQLQERIPETDFVVPDNHYPRHVNERFDYVIANHVGEHSPNFVMFLRDLGELLVPNGVLFMALPDKKFTFDKYRIDTPLSHLLYDYYKNVEEISDEHLLEIELYYDLEFIGQRMELSNRFSNDRLRRAIEQKPHIGIHCHVFRSETFLPKVFYPLVYMELIPFRLLKFVSARAEHAGEMIGILQKQKASDIPFATKDFYNPE